VADMLALQLQLDGYTVFTAYSSAEAIPVIEQHSPDGVLFDIGMPDLDGHDLASLIRHRYKNHLVLVAVTGADDDQPRVAAAIDLADHYLRKPVDLDALRRLFPLRADDSIGQAL
jgi:DNA-binding response OmpR family regulator